MFRRKINIMVVNYRICLKNCTLVSLTVYYQVTLSYSSIMDIFAEGFEGSIGF